MKCNSNLLINSKLSVVIPNIAPLSILKSHFSSYLGFFSSFGIENIAFLGSEDDTFLYVKRYFPGIKCHAVETNSLLCLLREGALISTSEVVYFLNPMVCLSLFNLDFFDSFVSNDSIFFVSSLLREACHDGTSVMNTFKKKVFKKGLYDFEFSDFSSDYSQVSSVSLDSCFFKRSFLLSLKQGLDFGSFNGFYLFDFVQKHHGCGFVASSVEGLLKKEEVVYDFVDCKAFIKNQYLYFWVCNRSFWFVFFHIFVLIYRLFFFQPLYFRAMGAAIFALIVKFRNAHFKLF